MRIVVCDDHVLFLEAIATALSTRGHQVYTATTASQCLRVVDEQQPDVITVDVSLPDGDGVLLVNELHAVVPDTPVLVISALEPDEVSTRAADAGAAGFLRKDEPLETILASLVRAAARETVAPPRVRPTPGRRARTATEERLRYLTPREREVLVHILDGESTKTMARALGISYTTTRTHVQNVLQKLGVRSRLQAAALVGPERDELGLDRPAAPRLMPLAYPHVPRG